MPPSHLLNVSWRVQLSFILSIFHENLLSIPKPLNKDSVLSSHNRRKIFQMVKYLEIVACTTASDFPRRQRHLQPYWRPYHWGRRRFHLSHPSPSPHASLRITCRTRPTCSHTEQSHSKITNFTTVRQPRSNQRQNQRCAGCVICCLVFSVERTANL